jgi:hypothetical protein
MVKPFKTQHPKKMNKTHSHNSLSLAAVFRAVQECRAKPAGDPQRIIVLLAPLDFGLPLLYCELLRQRGAVLVRGGALDKSRLVFLKFLAHRTRVVPLLLTSPEVWRRWNRRRPLEAAQIRRRTYLVVECDAASSANSNPPNQNRRTKP